jgi:hypothetical protein
MVRQISSRQIRKALGRQYRLTEKGFDRFEDESYGRALVASSEFRAIAEELEEVGYSVIQVIQGREIVDPLVSNLDKPLGIFYLETKSPLKIEELARIRGLEKYVLEKKQANEWYEKEYIFGEQKNTFDSRTPRVFFWENVPIEERRRKFSERIRDLINYFIFRYYEGKVRIR